MNIEQQVQQAIEEFGELAHERFIVKTGYDEFYPHSNNEMYLYIDAIELKPLPELFEHDVKVYGDDAYLMWIHELHGISNKPINNDDIKTSFDFSSIIVTRKTSAALPFDIERAKAGDVVISNNDEIVNIDFIVEHKLENGSYVFYESELTPLTPAEWWDFAPWQDMKDAPRDGSEFTAITKDNRICTAYFEPEEDCFITDFKSNGDYYRVFHFKWLPLPKADK
jgi:hypothetical protein